MALIGKIRKQSGFLIIIIGIALAAFILGDFLSNRKYGGSNAYKANIIGEIDGEPILGTDFNNQVDESIEIRKQNSGVANLSQDEQYGIRQTTWDKMVNDLLLSKEVDKVGIGVSTNELNDMIRGKNPHMYIIQSFSDPTTGQFDPNTVVNFLKNLESVDPSMKQRYLMIEKAIKEDRLNTKFANLITKAFYVPEAFAKQMHTNNNDSATSRVFAIKYGTIADSLVKVADKDFEKYYKENKNRYKQEASRDIEYVSFQVKPSTEDIEKVKNEIDNVFEEFNATPNVASFVNANSDNRYDSSWIKRGKLSQVIDSIMFNSPINTIYGPYLDKESYNVARLVDVQNRPDSLRASHILISYKGVSNNTEAKLTKEQASAKADSIIKLVKDNSLKFDELASSETNDDVAARKESGDLNWFVDGAMVPEFNKAVINNPIGSVNKVETNFGYHIVKVTGKTTPVKKVKVAIVTLMLEPSSKTIQEYYNNASKFASDAKEKDFAKVAEESGYTMRLGERLMPTQNYLSGVAQAREVIRWAFNEKTKQNEISQVFDLEGNFIVAKLKVIREKGIAPLDQVKDYIEPLVKREKKAEMIIEKINSNIKSENDLLSKYSNLEMSLDTVAVTFSSNNIKNFGREDAVIGKIFATDKGKISTPIIGNQAVFVTITDSKKVAPTTNDLQFEKAMLNNNFVMKAQRDIFKILKENAKIKDNRIMFY